jgi:transposase-like protein
MTSNDHNSKMGDVLELLINEGFDGIGEALRVLLNLAMHTERQKYLGVGPYERSEKRIDQANGFKPKTIATRVGDIELSIPQVRESGFYPKSLEKGERSERALRLALAEMYIQGVSTRKVQNITEQLCGFEVSSTQVSKASKELDDILEKWRDRPLGGCPYVILDARYEKVREGGHVVDCAVLIAVGIEESGKRKILGVSVALSEAEIHWRNFLQGLQKRGLTGIKLITSDDHSGLKAALKTVFPSVPWQRCQYHLQQNAQAYVPRHDMKKEVASAIRAIFNAPDDEEAGRLLKKFIEKYEKKAPRLASWAEENIPEGFTVFKFAEEYRVKLRTSNMLERLNKEIRRRTRVLTVFPNEASCLRLISAFLMETSEEWETGRIYLKA